MNCRCGCATISRESETVRPVFTSARGRAPRVGDEIDGTALVLVAPASPVVEPLEVRLHVGLRRQLRSGHARLLAGDGRVCHAGTATALELVAERDQRQVERVERVADAVAPPLVAGARTRGCRGWRCDAHPLPVDAAQVVEGGIS